MVIDAEFNHEEVYGHVAPLKSASKMVSQLATLKEFQETEKFFWKKQFKFTEIILNTGLLYLQITLSVFVPGTETPIILRQELPIAIPVLSARTPYLRKVLSHFTDKKFPGIPPKPTMIPT